ncbi:MAG: ferrous iron transport protein B [Candidatus Thermoplasmatota archaeon]|nr:ferrous iron transport protein B [Candidatus Thermoplasmatota archaeon]
MRIALAGNANVGKSVIFNALTGLHQHIGNWPGKTIERAEGTLKYRGHTIDVIDLPGIYSLSSFSQEEDIARDYILNEKPDVVINVVDATALERNLYFTLQLLEMERPLVIALNQMDLAKTKGIDINIKELQELLGVPVVSVVAIRREGLTDLLETAIKTDKKPEKETRYSDALEDAIRRVEERIKTEKYPKRWLAIKLLEGTAPISIDIEDVKRALEDRINTDAFSYIASERYRITREIVDSVQKIVKPEKSFSEKLDAFLTDPLTGSISLIFLFIGIFALIFFFGNIISATLEALLLSFFTGDNILYSLYEGFVAGLTIVLPYIVPFYLLLGILEDTGYIARAAFLADRVMHKLGVHGKAIIPLLLSFGCNVPGCLGCRIMEGERERDITIFLSTLVPCSAISIVVMSVVGRTLGLAYVLLLYALILVILFVLGRIAYKITPGEAVGLIMEMPSLRKPSISVVAKQTYHRTMDFIEIAFPIIIAGSLFMGVLNHYGLIEPIAGFFSPITEGWLLIPALTGVVLIFGVVRKELTVTMLFTLYGTTELGAIMSAPQMLTFTLVVMLYTPCLSTIAALLKEIGPKRTAYIVLFETFFAIAIGGIFARVLMLF